MGYKVKLDKRAEKQLDKLPEAIKIKIACAIQDLTNLNETSSSIKKLKTPLIGYRKRIGNYRILFDIDTTNTLTIYKIKHRKDAYK